MSKRNPVWAVLKQAVQENKFKFKVYFLEFKKVPYFLVYEGKLFLIGYLTLVKLCVILPIQETKRVLFTKQIIWLVAECFGDARAMCVRHCSGLRGTNLHIGHFFEVGYCPVSRACKGSSPLPSHYLGQPTAGRDLRQTR